MEFAKIIIKVLYFLFLYIVLYLALGGYSYNQAKINVLGLNFDIIVLCISVLLMYITFETVYQFLVSNELIIKYKKLDDDDGDDDTKKSSNKVKASVGGNKVNIESDSLKISKSVIDHTHKYIQDKIFD